jgi:hypothetical protein
MAAVAAMTLGKRDGAYAAQAAAVIEHLHFVREFRAAVRFTIRRQLSLP